MKNNKTLFIAIALIIVFGFLAYFFYSKDAAPVENPTTIPDSSITYNNEEYGFTFSLPDNWQGYSVVQNTWQGNPLKDTTAKESGPKLLIRNPKWTSTLPYEDIPILVFTLKQWDSYIAEDFTVSAAPILATELARNNVYVFALPPRWDFDYSKDVEEAQNILESNPIKAFDIEKLSLLENGRQCYIFNHEATTAEPYAVTEFLDLTISGNEVVGTKNGTQKGPDMTNGYGGAIAGSTSGDTINSVFSFVIEGSANKESEIYKAKTNKTGLEKLRYPLIEKEGILVPDTTKEFNTLFYERVVCRESN